LHDKLFTFSYHDQQGDKIQMSSDPELAALFENQQKATLRIELKKTPDGPPDEDIAASGMSDVSETPDNDPGSAGSNVDGAEKP